MSDDVVTIPDFTSESLSSLLSLDGKAAVVTGGGRGIGAAIVRRLSELGANVLVADLEKPPSEVLASRGRVAYAKADVTDSTSLAEAADFAVREFSGLDIWVNNAAMYPPSGSPLDVTDNFVDTMLHVNTRGTYAGAREAARRMRPGGVIINIVSTSGFRASVGTSVYVASKHAVVGLTKGLALDLAPRGIRVLGVAPGPTDTPGALEQLDAMRPIGYPVERITGPSRLGRKGQPDDVGRVVAILATDVASWITGTVIPVEAGYLAG